MIPHAEQRQWTQQGSQDAAKHTYDEVKKALAPVVANHGYGVDIFLQGSYANATNTRGDSDVDIVVLLESVYVPDTRRLNEAEKAREAASGTPSTTTSTTFRIEVEMALWDHFGVSNVQSKNKCLFIPKAGGRVDADVVPAFEHRLYTAFPASGSPSYIEGISIKPLDGSRIVNYPKRHIANGQTKNQAGGGNYKKTVRQVKRLRRRAVEMGVVRPDAAPGYMLECMVYNVPTHYFTESDDVDRLRSVMAWLSIHSAEEMARDFKSCDEVHWLFRTDPGRHNEYTAKNVIDQMWKIL